MSPGLPEETPDAPVSRLMALAVAASLGGVSCAASGPLQVLDNDGEFIRYAGSIELSGTYHSGPGNLELMDQVCFLPDAAGQRRLPQAPGQDAPHRLCFSNGDDARQWLGLEAHAPDRPCLRGNARLTIRDYQRYIAESEGTSRAELVALHAHGPATVVACDVLRSP